MNDNANDARTRWEALPAEEKRRQLDAAYHLSDQEWMLLTCADCDPSYMDEADEDHGRWEVPFTIVVPVGTEPPSHCLRCGSHLGITRDSVPTRVRVSYVLRGEG